MTIFPDGQTLYLVTCGVNRIIAYFCQAIVTGPGKMVAIPYLQFEVLRVESYPTTLSNAVQHNALWDARALMWASDGRNEVDSRLSRETFDEAFAEASSMAKKKRSSDYPQPAALSGPDKASMRRYEVEDALRTLQSAAKIIGDKKLMAEVKTMAKEKASEMEAVANQAAHLAKMGLISDKQMAKHKLA